jgi:ribosomal protein L29
MPAKTINQLLTDLHSVKVEFVDEELLNAMFEQAVKQVKDPKEIRPLIQQRLKNAYQVAMEIYQQYDCRVQLVYEL